MTPIPAPRDRPAARLRVDGLAPWSAAALIAALAVWCWLNEGGGATLVFTLATTGALVAFLAAATRRVFFAALAVGCGVGFVLAISWLKQSHDDMVLHVWDIAAFVFFPGDAVALFDRWPAETVVCAVLCGLALVVLALAFRAERPRYSRLWPLCALVLCVGAAAGAAARKPERAHLQYFWFDLHLASFYASFADLADIAARGGLFTASADGGSQAPLAPAGVCAPRSPPPHILLIHEESVTTPEIFPGLAYDPGVLPFFRSDDGQLHKLRVETYGGASWLTEFSIFAGVSSRAFGSMRNFVQVFTAGKLGDPLPRILAGCGYRNIMFTPWDKTFMAVARFYESIGFSEILDRKAQRATRENERDRFFFANVLNRIASHLAQSRQPLFVFVETMSAHWPYDEPYMPEVAVAGGGPDTPPQMHEYLRRLAMVKMDDDALRADLASRFPGGTLSHRALRRSPADSDAAAARPAGGQGGRRRLLSRRFACLHHLLCNQRRALHAACAAGARYGRCRLSRRRSARRGAPAAARVLERTPAAHAGLRRALLVLSGFRGRAGVPPAACRFGSRSRALNSRVNGAAKVRG